MPCKDCYNGCVEPVSDKCVKYTGPDLEFLDITSGDPLSAVLTAITNYLEEISSGEFSVELNQEIICEWITEFFPVGSTNTIELPDILNGIIEAICTLKTQIEETSNSPTYDVACLEEVTSSSSTEDILQQLILQFCQLVEDFTSFSETPNTYESIVIPLSDLITNLTTGTTKAYFTMPFAMTVTSVKANVLVVQTAGSVLTFDINKAGVSILSTKLTIDNNETTSLTATAPAVISDSNLAIDSVITLDIDQVGTAGAKGAMITIIGNRI